MSHEVLAIHSLSLEFDGEPLFLGLERSLLAGKNLLISGANGSGKTSLLKILAGELKATQGSVSISDAIYMPADPVNPGFRKVAEYFQLTGGAQSQTTEFQRSVHPRIDGKSMAALSSGEFKAAALARVLSIPRTIYLLDEPTITLDSATIGSLMDEINKFNNKGASFVISTNNAEDFSAINYEVLALQKA